MILVTSPFFLPLQAKVNVAVFLVLLLLFVICYCFLVLWLCFQICCCVLFFVVCDSS